MLGWAAARPPLGGPVSTCSKRPSSARSGYAPCRPTRRYFLLLVGTNARYAPQARHTCATHARPHIPPSAPSRAPCTYRFSPSFRAFSSVGSWPQMHLMAYR